MKRRSPAWLRECLKIAHKDAVSTLLFERAHSTQLFVRPTIRINYKCLRIATGGLARFRKNRQADRRSAVFMLLRSESKWPYLASAIAEPAIAGRDNGGKMTFDWSGKRVLVTGGGGLIGSHLCERLLTDNAEVLCADNHFTGRRTTSHISLKISVLKFCATTSVLRSTWK